MIHQHHIGLFAYMLQFNIQIKPPFERVLFSVTSGWILSIVCKTMSKDNISIRKFVYWPNFELSEDGSNIEVGTGAGLDVKVTISNSLVQCVGQTLTEKCRWFKVNVKYLASGQDFSIVSFVWLFRYSNSQISVCNICV